MKMTFPSRLSDGEVVAEVARLATCERASKVDLLVPLGELYARRLHEHAGFASLFTYCVEVLHLSEQEAYDRMKARSSGAGSLPSWSCSVPAAST